MDLKTLAGDDARDALNTPAMVPPPRPSQFTGGATADLREAMARFSNAADHGERRAAIDEVMATFDLEAVEHAAAEVMADHFDGGDLDVVAAGWTVPSFTLATVFGFGDQRQQIRDDTEAVTRVIGRGEPSNPESDAATERLLALFAQSVEPVAPVSILYQNFDATGALLPNAVRAAFAVTGPPATGHTVRVAEEPLRIGEHELTEGEAVLVDLEHMRWGAGPHACPGQDLATAIVAGAVRAIVDAKYVFEASRVEVDDQNVPVQFVLEAPRT